MSIKEAQRVGTQKKKDALVDCWVSIVGLLLVEVTKILTWDVSSFFLGGDINIEHPYHEQAKNKPLLGGAFKQFSKNVHPLWKNQLGVIQPPTNRNLVLNFNWIM